MSSDRPPITIRNIRDAFIAAQIPENHAIREELFDFCRTNTIPSSIFYEIVILHSNPVEYIESMIVGFDFNMIGFKLARFFLENKKYRAYGYISTRFPVGINVVLPSSIKEINKIERDFPGFLQQKFRNIWAKAYANEMIDIMEFILSFEDFKTIIIDERVINIPQINVQVYSSPSVVSTIVRCIPELYHSLENFSIMCEEESLYELYVHGLGMKTTLELFSPRFIFENIPLLQIEERFSKSVDVVKCSIFSKNPRIFEEVPFGYNFEYFSNGAFNRDFFRMLFDILVGEERNSLIDRFKDDLWDASLGSEFHEASYDYNLASTRDDFIYSEEIPYEFVRNLPGYIPFSHPEDTIDAWIEDLFL